MYQSNIDFEMFTRNRKKKQIKSYDLIHRSNQATKLKEERFESLIMQFYEPRACCLSLDSN